MIRLSSLAMAPCLLAMCLGLFACGEAGGDMQILGLQPQSGPTRTQTPVTVTGANFRTDIGYTVYFGTSRSPQVTIVDPENLLVVAPDREEEGRVDITISADDGQAFRIVDAYEYRNLGGNVVEQLGSGPTKQDQGNLAY